MKRGRTKQVKVRIGSGRRGYKSVSQRAQNVIEPSSGSRIMSQHEVQAKLFDGPTIYNQSGNVRIVATKKPNEDLYVI